MATESLKHRSIKDESAMPKESTGGERFRRDKKMAMAKRGLRSLAIALAVPVAFAIIEACLFRSAPRPRSARWFPPLWTLHAASVGSALFMGLSGWLVWAEGGFHQRPAAVQLYVGQLGMGLAWAPLVLGLGARRLGLVLCLAWVGALFGCSKVFKVVNPIAGDLVKPCISFAAFVALVNFMFIYM